MKIKIEITRFTFTGEDPIYTVSLCDGDVTYFKYDTNQHIGEKLEDVEARAISEFKEMISRQISELQAVIDSKDYELVENKSISK